MDERAPESPSVKSAYRALELLELLTREGRSLSFSDLQTALSYPKASLHGLLRTMTAARWITLDPASRRYALGVRVWEAGIAYTKMLPIEALARPIMEHVRNTTGETVQLAVLDGFEALYVAKVDGHHMLRLDSSVGQRLKPHATGVGKVLLSGLADERLKSWLGGQSLERYTPNTITAPAKLMKDLAGIRQAGYATDREERTLGAACVAVGVRNHLGAIAAAMSVSAPAVRFGKKEQRKALAALTIAASELSTALGYAPSGAAPSVSVAKPAGGATATRASGPRRSRRGNAS